MKGPTIGQECYPIRDYPMWYTGAFHSYQQHATMPLNALQFLDLPSTISSKQVIAETLRWGYMKASHWNEWPIGLRLTDKQTTEICHRQCAVQLQWNRTKSTSTNQQSTFHIGHGYMLSLHWWDIPHALPAWGGVRGGTRLLAKSCPTRTTKDAVIFCMPQSTLDLYTVPIKHSFKHRSSDS